MCVCLVGFGVSYVTCGVFFVQEALRRVRRSFKACPDLNAPMDEESDEDMGESDDELMATATRLSLRCPLGLVSGVMLSAVLSLCFHCSCIWSVCSAVLIYYMSGTCKNIICVGVLPSACARYQYEYYCMRPKAKDRSVYEGGLSGRHAACPHFVVRTSSKARIFGNVLQIFVDRIYRVTSMIALL